MATLAKLEQWRDALLEARAAGTKRVEAGDQAVTYKSDDEMAAALSNVERRIENIKSTPVRRARFKASSGW